MISNIVKLNLYQDSVALMQIAAQLKGMEGIAEASLMMGTAPNKEILHEAGLLSPQGEAAGPNDLVIALRANSEDAISKAVHEVDQLLEGKQGGPGERRKARSIRTLAEGVTALPGANLALISTPGLYAAAEARKALELGLHTMIFSDNVSVEDERALKELAVARGLLLMGPDCGTAIISGVPLGFANVVRRGPVGVVGASGTGMQEITTLVDRYGSGISQAIGTGSHDLSQHIGGAMTIQGLRALLSDPQTEVIVLVSKPPHPAVAARVLEVAASGEKPVVVIFLGAKSTNGSIDGKLARLTFAHTLEEAARLAVTLVGGRSIWAPQVEPSSLPTVTFAQHQKYVRGLFSGGTFCSEATIILSRALGTVYSNTPISPDLALPDPSHSIQHTCLDMGADEFTVGRPHPMIDMSARSDRIFAESHDPEVAVLLLDVVLGYGSAQDPAGALAAAIREARRIASTEGRDLAVVAHVCGTTGDPQGLESQRAKLAEAGATLASSNAAAAQLAASLVVDRQTHAVGSADTEAAVASSGAGGGGRGAMTESPGSIDLLFRKGPGVLNVGIAMFVPALTAVNAPHLQLEWHPPAWGNAESGMMLAALSDSTEPGSLGARIKEANEKSLQLLLSADPVWEDVRPARDIFPEMAGRFLLHAGPPIEWERMCGPMKGAIIGAILFEGWADDPETAQQMAASGDVQFAPCHHFGAVGPMAGVVSPSMPVCVVRNASASNLAYATLNEGLGKVLRYGAYGPDVLTRLSWMRDRLGPALGSAVRALGGVQLKSVIAQGLQMGDECHNRNVASTSLLSRILAPALAQTVEDHDTLIEVLRFLADNNHFFLNLSMAACKASLDAAHGVPHSTMVTAMARNGVDFGIRVSGLGDRWFIGPANIPDGLYFPGFDEEDAAPDLGDSAITETAGIGGFAIGAAPAIIKFVGGSPEDALAYTEEMYGITLGRNPSFSLPALSFAGTPTGIDVRKVLDSNVLPLINTGIAHKEAGIGQIGAGLVRPPAVCFEEALRAMWAIDDRR